MSWYGNYEKDNLLDEMVEFLQDHPAHELLEIAAAALERTEES